MPVDINSRRKILVVEDNELNTKLVLRLLGLDGYQTCAADTAEKGIELALQHPPDLILLDIRLPGMDGLEAVKKLREYEQLSKTVFVAISAYAMPTDIQGALDGGFDDYLTKPFDVKMFREKIASLLDRKDYPAFSESQR